MNLMLKRALITLLLTSASHQVIAGDSAPDFIGNMASFQYFGQKAYFSLEQENKPLAKFYLHELEETLEKVEKIEEYGGYKVGSKARTLLKPKLENLDKKIEAEDWKAAMTGFEEVVGACNTCHKITNHEYILIVKPEVNPYMQSFKAIKEKQD